MKKVLFAIIMLLSFSSMTYASFPVTEQESDQSIKQSTEEKSFLADLKLPNFAPVSSDGPAFGIVALCCGVVGLVFPVLGIPAIVFGAMGLKRAGRGMAIAGLVLGIIEIIWVFVLLLFWGAFLMSGAGYGL